jgi:hypothetical protein
MATIERLQDQDFQKWIDANYWAVKQGVKIKRIFIVHKRATPAMRFFGNRRAYAGE